MLLKIVEMKKSSMMLLKTKGDFETLYHVKPKEPLGAW
jgi:hypothetical protein